MIIRCLLRLALSYFYFPLRHHDVKSRLEFLFNNDKEWCAFVKGISYCLYRFVLCSATRITFLLKGIVYLFNVS